MIDLVVKVSEVGEKNICNSTGSCKLGWDFA